jgi:hypothetical protein
MDVTAERYVDKQIPEKAITAIKEALAQTEFIKHEVENADDWSEWVCPDPKNYLMKCCDCGLVHEAEFAVVRYKSETERDDCDIVNDPNLQAVFRMRRSEEWAPEDTAHRVGGLPMAEPEHGWTPERIAGMARLKEAQDKKLAQPEQPKVRTGNCLRIGVCASEGHKIAPQRTWVGLTDEEIKRIGKLDLDSNYFGLWYDFAKAIEAKLRSKNI